MRRMGGCEVEEEKELRSDQGGNNMWGLRSACIIMCMGGDIIGKHRTKTIDKQTRLEKSIGEWIGLKK
jgi:hypothetical protein